uniref:Uncharacterized protein n=1 Tax=Anguilla anguilla TaxID=7936 RepID=A0A0E9VKI7_ANGAN
MANSGGVANVDRGSVGLSDDECTVMSVTTVAYLFSFLNLTRLNEIPILKFKVQDSSR